MVPFLILFVVFLFILHYFLRKNTRTQKELEENFWKRENEANSVRKKDISGLDYIILPLDTLPLDLDTEAGQAIKSLAGQKILNLTGYTNTDLKLEYGPANLELLSEYDNNFTKLVQALVSYSNDLLSAGRKEDARTLLEFGVSIQADAGAIYTALAGLYQESGETEQIKRLIDAAGQLRTISKTSIQEKLSAFL